MFKARYSDRHKALVQEFRGVGAEMGVEGEILLVPTTLSSKILAGKRKQDLPGAAGIQVGDTFVVMANDSILQLPPAMRNGIWTHEFAHKKADHLSKQSRAALTLEVCRAAARMLAFVLLGFYVAVPIALVAVTSLSWLRQVQQRKHEYEADAMSMQVGGADLSGALSAIKDAYVPSSAERVGRRIRILQTLFSTHGSFDRRIARLA